MHFMYSFYQDRLGTKHWERKTLKKRGVRAFFLTAAGGDRGHVY